MEEQLRQLFDSLGGESRVGSFESFKSVMSDRENRVNLFNQIKGQYEGNFEEFETSIGFAQPTPEVNVQGNLGKLYVDLGGYDRLGDIERFFDAMSESTNRYNLYRQIKDTEKGTFEEFSESLGYSSKEPQEEETEDVASFDTDILSPERAKERAQSYLDQGVAPIINDKGEVEFTEIEGGTLGELEQDKYGYYMPIESFSKPGEWAVERWARGDQKIYLGPTEELSTVLNSLSEEDIKRGYESNGNFKQQFWNANAFELYNTLGVKTAEEYSFVANQNDNLFVGRKALQNISERQSKLVEEASLRMREIAPAETDLLDDLAAKADMIEGRLNSPDITESERLDLEADLGIIKNTFEEIVTKPIQTEEGVVTLAQLPEFSQQFQSAELVNSVNARFQELYKGSNQEQMDLLAERTLEEANDKLRKLYDKYGQVGYVAGQALNKGKTLWYGAMSTVAGLAGRLLREDYDLSDRDARQDVNWWNKTNVSGEDIALEGFTEAAMIYSTLAETAQGDRNTGGLRRNQYIVNDNLTAVLDDDYNILSIEDNDGFNVMSDLSDEAVQSMQAEITRNKEAVEGDWSFWRGSSTAADVFLNLIPLFSTTAGIRSGGRWVSKKMLEKKGLGKMSEALSGGLSIGAGVFVTTYPSYFISNLKEGVPVSKAEKLAIAQASVESILTPLVGPVESKALRVLTQAERVSMKNAASAYLSGKITIGGLAQKWGKIGKGLSVDVLKELSEETLVQAGTDTVSVLGGIDSKSSFNEYLDVWFSTIGVSSFLGGMSRVPEIRESPTSASAFTSQIKGWSKTITKNLLKDVDRTSTLIDEVGKAMGLSQTEIDRKKAILFAAQQAQENLDPSIPQAVRDTYLSNVVEHHILDDNLNNVQDELLRNSFSIASERLKLTNEILADNRLRTAYETLLGDKISDYDSAKKGDFSLKDLLANIEDGVEISSGVKKRALDHLKKVYERIGDSEKEPDFSPRKRFILTTVLQMMHQFIDTYDHSTAEPTRKTTQDSPVPKTRIIHKDDALETPHEEGATVSVSTSRRKENRKVELKTTKNGQESDGKRYRSLSDAVTELGETLTEDLEKYQGEEVILNSISDSPTQSVASFSIGTETVEIPLPNRHTSYLEQLKELEDNDSTKEDVKAPKSNVSYYRKKLEEMGDQDYLVVEGDEAAKAKEAGLTITEDGISKSEIKQKLFDMGESYKTPPSDTSTKKPTTPETEAPAEVKGTTTEEETPPSEPKTTTEETPPVEEPAPEPETTEPVEEPTDVEEDSEAPLTRPVDTPAPVEEPFSLTYRGITYTRDEQGEWFTPKGNTPSGPRVTALEEEYQKQQSEQVTTEEEVTEQEPPNVEDDTPAIADESDVSEDAESVDANEQTAPEEPEEIFNEQVVDPQNINTTESAVQFLMSQGLTLEDAQALIEDLGGEEGFFDSLNSFINESDGLASFRGTGEPVWDKGLVDLYRLTQGDTMASVISRALIKKVSFKQVIDYLKGKGYDIEYTDAMREADKELNGRPPSYDHTDLAKARKEAAKKLGFKTDKEYLVTELEEAFPITGPAAEIWKIIKPIAELLGLTASFDTNFLDEFTPGLFNPTTGWIKIDPLARNIGEVLLEETIHALTAKVIDKVLTKKTDGLTDIQIQAVRDLQKMYNEVKNSKDFKGKYSVSNIYEFIGHLGDEEVRNNLIKRGIDFLQRIYDAILDILGIPANAYTYSKQILSDIVSNTRFFKEEGILAPGIKKNLSARSPIIYQIPDTPYSIQDGLLHKNDKPSKTSTAKFDYQELIRRDIAHQKKSVSKDSPEFKTLEQIERSAGKFFKENPNLNTNKIDYDLSRNIRSEGSEGPYDYSSMSDLTDRSGGANGGDTEWELIGKKFGVKNFVHYWAGRKTPRGNRGLSKEELAEGVDKVKQTYGVLVRPNIPKYHNLHGRNWFQVKNADAVYAVSIIQNPGEKGEARYPNSAGKQVVAGGTGYAVEMAIQHNKPVYVYHQSPKMENPQGWYKWSAKDMEFIPVDTPVLTRNYAGIGSRNINEAGRKAISDVYAATLNRVKGRSQPKPETPTEPTQQSTSFPDYSYSKLGTSVFLPENNHVTIDNDRAASLGKDKSGAIKAFRTRKEGFEEAFEKDRAIGNPFSAKGYHGTIPTGSVESAVDAFFRWLEGTEHTNYQQPYRQMIIDNLEDLRGREIIYYKDIGQPSHATALDYFLNSKQPTTSARSNKVTIEDGVEKTFQKKGDKWEKVNVVTSNEKTKQALDKAKKDVKIVPKSNQNVPGKMIATGREAMIANSATPIPSYELRSSGRQTIKTTYTTKADHKGFDLSIIDSVTAGEYEGDVNSETMLPEGYGKMIFPDGTYYEGMWYAGKPNGWGRKTTFKYNRVLNRRRSGKTEESEQREEVHTEGLFIQGKYIGNKAFDIVDNRKTTSKSYDILYSGTTNVLGKPHGWGIQKFHKKNGELYAVYEGEFFNGKRSGKGAVTFLDDRPTEYQNSPLTLAKYNYDYLDSLNEYSRFKLEFKSGATEIKRVPKQVAARSKKTGKVYLKKGSDDLYILDTNTGVYDLIVDEEFETYVKRLTSPDFVSFGALEGEDKAEGYLTQSSDSGILRNHRVTWGTATPNKAGVNKSGVVVNTQKGEYFIVSPEQSKNSVFKLQGDSAPFAAQILTGKDPEIVLSEIVDLVLAEFPEKPGRGYEQRVQRLVDRIVEDYIPTDVRIDTVQGRKLVRELVVDIANRATSKQQLAVNHIKASKVGNNIYAVKMSGDVAMVLNDSEGNIISHYVGGGNPLTYSLSEGMPVLNTPKPRVLVVRVDKGQTLSILNNFANAESSINDFIATGNGKAMDFREYLKQHKSTDAAFVSIDHEKPGEYRDYFPKDADRNYVIPPFYQTHYTITTRAKKGEEERPSRKVPVYFAPEINEFVTIEPSDGRRTRVPKSRLKEVHDNAQAELYEADRRMRSLDSENDIDQIRANIIEELANIPEEEEVPPSSKTSTKYSFQLQYNGQLYEHNRKGDWFRLEGDTKTKVSKLIYPVLNRNKIAEGMTTGKRAMRVNTKSSKHISGRGVIVQDQGGHVSFSDGVFDKSSLEGSGYAAVMYNDGNIMIHEGTFENGVLYEGTQIDIFPNGQAFATTVEAPKDDGDMGERVSEFKDYSIGTEELTNVEEGSDELSQDDLDIENQEISEDTEEMMAAVFSGDIQSTTPEKDIPDTGAIPLNNLDTSNAKKIRNLLQNFSKSLDKSINFTDWGRYEKFVADVKNRLSESLESLPVETKPSGKADANLLLGIFDVLSAKTSVKEFLSGRDIGIDDRTFYQEWRADRRSEKFERQDQALSEDEAIMQERQVELNNMFLDAMIGGNYDALNILIENFKNSGVPDVKLRLLKELPKLIDQNTVRENLEGALEKGNFFEMAMAGAFKSKCD